MTFDEWWAANREAIYQDINSHNAARLAWAYAQLHATRQEEWRNAALEEAAQVCESMVGRSVYILPGTTIYEGLAKQIRSLKEKS
jgi:hypothetical protein